MSLHDIINSEGFKIEQTIIQRNSFFYILDGNYNELLNIINFCIKDPFLLNVQFKGDEREIYIQRQEAIRILLLDTNRKLFNFITGSYTILEYNKCFMQQNRDLSVTKVDLENFYKKPIAGFMFGLRNHFLHGSFIDFTQSYGIKLNENGEQEVNENSFFFDLDKIIVYKDENGKDRWTKNAEVIGKQYITDNLPKIAVDVTCNNYFNEIQSLHNSITKSFADKYVNELNELQQARERCRESYKI